MTNETDEFDPDALIALFPNQVWDVLAVVAIVLGFLLAFLGLRVLALTAFVCGTVVGGFAGAFVLGQINVDMSEQTWLIIVGICGLVFGLFVACMVKLSRYIVAIALALMLAGVIIQYGVVDAIGSDIFVWVVLGVLVVALLYVAYKTLDYTLILGSAVAGGIGVTLGLSHFFNAGISIYAIYADPSSVVCENTPCWVVMAVGGTVCLCGLLYQTQRLRSRKRKEQGSGETRKSERRGVSPTDLEAQDLHQRDYIEKRVSHIRKENEQYIQVLERNHKANIDTQESEIARLKEELVRLSVHDQHTKEQTNQRIQLLEKQVQEATQGLNRTSSSVNTVAIQEHIALLTDEVNNLRHEQQRAKMENFQLSKEKHNLEQQLLNTEDAVQSATVAVARGDRELRLMRETLLGEREELKELLQLARHTDRVTKQRAQEATQSVQLAHADGTISEAELKQIQDRYDDMRNEENEQSLEVSTLIESELARVNEAISIAIPVAESGIDQPENQHTVVQRISSRFAKGSPENVSMVSLQIDKDPDNGGLKERRATVDEEMEEVLEDQIDWRDVAKQTGEGIVKISKALGLFVYLVLKNLVLGTRYLALQCVGGEKARSGAESSSTDLA